jgi:hypothetical protein
LAVAHSVGGAVFAEVAGAGEGGEAAVGIGRQFAVVGWGEEAVW